MKRIKSSADAHEFAAKWVEKGFTHVCVHSIPVDENGGGTCKTPLRLHRHAKGDKTKVTWVTTHATTHIARYHKTHVVANEVHMREQDAQLGRMTQMLGVKEDPVAKGSMTTTASGSKKSLDKFVLSKRQWGLTRQARWYIYNDMKVSKRQFENPLFKDMLNSMSDKPSESGILTVDMLKKYVRAEFNVFVLFLKHIIVEKVAQSKGNTFAQIIHDGGTLASKKKYQGMGIQFIDPKWRCNHVICTGFLRGYDGTAEGISNLLKGPFLERTSMSVDSIVG